MTTPEQFYADVTRIFSERTWGEPRMTPVWTGAGPAPMYFTVDAHLKGAREWATGAEARAELFEVAQTLIGAMEAAGYRHLKAPVVHIAGEVHNGPEGPLIAADGRLSLKLAGPDSGTGDR